jgi:hypothetical protein
MNPRDIMLPESSHANDERNFAMSRKAEHQSLPRATARIAGKTACFSGAGFQFMSP